MTTGPSNRFVEIALKRANEALRGAGILLKEREFHGAVSRAYYCVFHAAEAVLYSKGIKARSHAGLRSLFGEHIVKPGIMGREFADILRDVFVQGNSATTKCMPTSGLRKSQRWLPGPNNF